MIEIDQGHIYTHMLLLQGSSLWYCIPADQEEEEGSVEVMVVLVGKGEFSVGGASAVASLQKVVLQQEERCGKPFCLFW